MIHPKGARSYNIPTITIKGGTLNTNGLVDRAIIIDRYYEPNRDFPAYISHEITLNLDGTTINSTTNGIYSDFGNTVNLTNGAKININNSDGYAISGAIRVDLSGDSAISGTYKDAVDMSKYDRKIFRTYFSMSDNSKITGTATGNVLEIPAPSQISMSGNASIDVNLSASKNTDLAVVNIYNATLTLNDNATHQSQDYRCHVVYFCNNERHCRNRQ